jgi:hypothetical protein
MTPPPIIDVLEGSTFLLRATFIDDAFATADA